ncbi:MAG: hypothetical protein RLT05_17270, partial [Bauldia litoralis]
MVTSMIGSVVAPAYRTVHRAAGALLAFAALTVSTSAVGQPGWTERHFAPIDARLLVHARLEPQAVRPAKSRFRTVARWRWPHAKTIYVSIETAPLAADRPLTSLLEEMDGKPRREPRADGLPAIRTELIFEGTLERRFWIHSVRIAGSPSARGSRRGLPSISSRSEVSGLSA